MRMGNAHWRKRSLACAALLSAVAAAEGAQAHALPDSVAAWGRGAQLYAGLGSFHRQVTTTVPQAQAYFDQGVRLLWAFNHDEAARSFAYAATLDPRCASCYWGLALALGPNYNFRSMDGARAHVALEALARARAAGPGTTPVEQALIAALAVRVPGTALGHDNIVAVLSAYADAMQAVAQDYPKDLDVQTLYAESLITIDPWHQWTADGKPGAHTREAQRTLEAVLRAAPAQPGANHYYIHLMEASPHPEAALGSAERLRGMMPAAGHLEHMPAHIFQRVGRYEDAAAANRAGIAADQAYLRGTAPPDYYPMYLRHNYEFLAYAAAMAGRKAETLAAVQGYRSVVQDYPDAMSSMHGAAEDPRQYGALVRFGLWDELLAQLPPDRELQDAYGGYLFGRGVALAARGRLEEARATLGELQALAAAVPADKEGLRSTLAVATPIVAARIAASEYRSDEAVGLLSEAVAAEDRQPYQEPARWFFPARHLLGAQLLEAGRAAEAERVYQEDLRRNPANGWALYGLAAALKAQGKAPAAARVAREFSGAWRFADVRLVASAFWFAGPDTSSCECQRDRAGAAGAGGKLRRP
jgi:tetratricopeptide (TPR) repeat protein